MSSTPNKAAPSPRAGMPAFGAFSGTKASMFLEKSNPGIRKSTPDSEALASSDDEAEQSRASLNSMQSKMVKSTRRTSWLNEMPPAHRKSSNTMSGPYSPTASHPTTPSTEQVSWTSAGSPSLASSGNWNTSNTSYPWGSIWNNENRKDPPSRLQEVLPSPTAVNQPTAKFLNEELLHTSGNRTSADPSFPFTIPLQPTPKTYRSQSYSVGQLDTTSAGSAARLTSSPGDPSRSRGAGQYPGLQRRSSRPGVLNERGHELGGLDRVREVEDDDDSHKDQYHEEYAASQARMIEKLAKENAELRQAAHSRERTPSTVSASGSATGSAFRNTRIRGPVIEESPLATDEGEEIADLHGMQARRSSEQPGWYSERPTVPSADNRNVESVKKAHWQTSLGFGSIPEPPQSRRHSFADVPTRHGSFSSTGKTNPKLHPAQEMTVPTDRDDELRGYELVTQEMVQGDDRECPSFRMTFPSEDQLKAQYSHNRVSAAAYFNASESSRRDAEASIQKAYAANNPYGRYPGVGTNLGPSAQPLYIVNFKCCRSDVFYIQEGTGLQVSPGDLVIVEADRGTDLGAVQHANVSWEQARYYKDYYAEEHYKWLMMFSQQTRNGGPNAVNPNGLHGLQGAPGSAVGGMGPQGHHGSHDVSHNDLKPKMIKRLAQNHEILALKDKEGNEAKAKRMCQQKVVEHRLNMEILDAEYQMDSKKLTFYYFADAYINFNSLVTDLFKIYKTRIWMSAINPASFVTPTASLGLPPAYGQPSFGAGRVSPAGRRRPQNLGYMQSPAPTYEDQYDTDRGLLGAPANGMRNQYFNSYQPFGAGPQQGALPVQGFQPNSVDPFTPYLPYQMLNPNAPNFASNMGPDVRNRGSNQAANTNLIGRFQSLSLGS